MKPSLGDRAWRASTSPKSRATSRVVFRAELRACARAIVSTVLTVSAIIVLPTMAGCSRRAPGPDECVAFAEMTFGVPFQSVIAHPAYKQTFDRLVTTCLTAPFERRVFVCTAETRAPLDCLRRFQPELFGDPEMVPLLPREPRLRSAPREVF